MNKTLSAAIIGVLLSFVLSLTAFPQSAGVVIRDAVIIDGTGRSAFRGDVRIFDGKIAKLSKPGKIKAARGDTVIDAAGMILSPGFIDIHNHSESGLLREGTAENQVSQGITTIFVGPDGGSPFPVADYLEKLRGKIAPNVGSFIGHATLREQVMNGDYTRPATADEIAKMQMLLERSMQEGAFGLSSGLEYDVGFSATTDELVELAKIAAKYNGIYMTHMRDEEEGLLDAIEEAARIGQRAKIPVQISHIKAGNKNVWGMANTAIAKIDAFRVLGFDITADQYPYTAWASTITVLVPSRKHEDRAEIEKGINNVGGADKVLITNYSVNTEYEGKTLEAIARSKGVSPAEIYIEIVKAGGAGVVCNSMNEEDVKDFYSSPWVMVSSDGGIGSRHPRGTGTFTRVLARFVRENKWSTLEEAIRKMTSLPAKRLGLSDRGVIRKGAAADLVLFDKDSVADNATFAEPQKLSSGIAMVWVNGTKVWEKEKVTGNLPGLILRRK
ncbi:MAG: D-aminoacylase [Pyrinomonadaceae bacterium]